MRVALAASLVCMVLAGCLSGDDAGDADGHFVYYSWNSVQSKCVNGRCTYGANSDSFSALLDCDSTPTLSWDANSWAHGSVTARVLDDSGTEVASHTVSSPGKGSEVVPGKPGTWTFEGSARDAHGSMQMRLSCG